MKTLGKPYRSCRSVPHELTQQAKYRVDICQLIVNLMDDRFFRRIVEGDEKWVYYYNPDASKQWFSLHQPVNVIVKKRSVQPQSSVLFVVEF